MEGKREDICGTILSAVPRVQLCYACVVGEDKTKVRIAERRFGCSHNPVGPQAPYPFGERHQTLCILDARHTMQTYIFKTRGSVDTYGGTIAAFYKYCTVLVRVQWLGAVRVQYEYL